MSDPILRAIPFDWESAGRDAGALLDGLAAVVVVGQDPVATARTALGLGRAQSGARRVAIADLLGEAEPLQRLVYTDDLHGIVDSFLYGVSLNRIAHRVPDAGELFILPTGTESVDYASLFPHQRWKRLASGFREVGALLILAAPAWAPGIEQLVASSDGAILVGDVVPPQLPVSMVLGTVRRAKEGEQAVVASPHAAPYGEAIPPDEDEAGFTVGDTGARRATDERTRGRTGVAPRSRRHVMALAAAALLLTALSGAGYWLATRPLADQARTFPPPGGDTLRRLPGQAGGGHQALADSAGVVASPADTLPPAFPANPADSSAAANFGVELLATNTQAGAMLKLQEERVTLPSATFAPVLIGTDSARWFKVIAGAYRTSAEADSLLVRLRAARQVEARNGRVVRVPFALLIRPDVQADSVAPLVAGYARRGLPVYALRQADGTAHLYAGAFESPDQAVGLAVTFRASGVPTTIVYRIGRVF